MRCQSISLKRLPSATVCTMPSASEVLTVAMATHIANGCRFSSLCRVDGDGAMYINVGVGCQHLIMERETPPCN